MTPRRSFFDKVRGIIGIGDDERYRPIQRVTAERLNIEDTFALTPLESYRYTPNDNRQSFIESPPNSGVDYELWLSKGDLDIKNYYKAIAAIKNSTAAQGVLISLPDSLITFQARVDGPRTLELIHPHNTVYVTWSGSDDKTTCKVNNLQKQEVAPTNDHNITILAATNLKYILVMPRSAIAHLGSILPGDNNGDLVKTIQDTEGEQAANILSTMLDPLTKLISNTSSTTIVNNWSSWLKRQGVQPPDLNDPTFISLLQIDHNT